MTKRPIPITQVPRTRAIAARPMPGRPEAVRKPEMVSSHIIDGVRIRLWQRDDSEEMEFELTFPTINEKCGRLMVGRELRRSPKDVLRLLEARGARFGTNNPEAVVAELLLTENLRVHRVTATPGWHYGVFVPARGFARTDDEAGREIRVRAADDLVPTYVGRTSGTSEGWRREVGAPAQQSSAVSFAILVALAAPLATDIDLPEGVLFNFFASSSTGKTTLARVAASVAGDPKFIGHWNTSKRGVEENSAAHNGYATILDDTEKAADDVATLRRTMTHIVTGGQSRIYSASVKDRLRPLTWFCFGLSTSPESMSGLALRKGSERTAGERVRLIDIPVPEASAGGVFDRLRPGANSIVKRSRATIDELERGIARHHGELFLDWLDLLDDLSPGEVRKRVQAFEDARPARDSVDGRLLRKFALVQAAGDLAVAHGILEWSPGFVAEVVDAMLAAARGEMRRDEARTNEGWRRLRAALDDPRQIPPLGSKLADDCSRERLVAVRDRYKGVEIVGVFGEKIGALFGGNLNVFFDPLRARGALLREPGRTDTDTVQVAIKQEGSVGPWRRRVYAVRADVLDDVLASCCAAESKPGSDEGTTTRDAADIPNRTRRSYGPNPGRRFSSTK